MSADPTWKSRFIRLADQLDRGFDAVKGRLAARFDRDDPLQILPYRGYGTRQRLFAFGRVLQDEPIGAAGEQDSPWLNLANTWKRLESDEVPFARLRARFRGWEGEVVADEEGYFRLDLDLAALALPGVDEVEGDSWHEIEFELLHPISPEGRSVRAAAPVYVPPAGAELGVISDLDDTVVESHVTDRLALARTVLLGNARTRLPFEGVAAFYQALRAGASGSAGNPVFYVSSSPWNLYDLLAELLDLHDIPRGPVLLRDLGIDRTKLFGAGHDDHKLGQIRPLLALYPRLPWILLGDSGQRDPEIYRQVVQDNPGRIRAIYIRRAGERPGRDAEVEAIARELDALGTPLLLVRDTAAAAAHAASEGWIRAREVPAVQEDAARDRALPTPAEAVKAEVR
jgi:phosphatidate phosphatase APP1